VQLAAPRRVFLCVASVVVYACVLTSFILSLKRLTVDSLHVTLFNSDSAIPVLMANARGLRLFDAYFWGQDRFGSLPFLIARGFAIATEFSWTPDRLHTLLIVWLFAAILPFVFLCRGSRHLAAAFFAYGITLVPVFREHFFDIAQLYPWQFLPLLCCLVFIRRQMTAPSPWRLVFLVIASFVACWMSILNLIPIVWFFLVEIAGRRPAKLTLRAEGMPVAFAMALAGGLEWILRFGYHRAALSEFGNEYRTSFAIGRYEISQGIEGVAGHLSHSPFLAPDLAGFVATAIGVYVLFFSPWLRSKCSLETLKTGVVFGLSAVSHIPVLASFHHFIASNFPERHFFFLHFGFAIALTLCAASFVRSAVLERIIALVACAVLFWFPASQKNPEYARLVREANSLCDSAKGVVIGPYWSTYVYAALSERPCIPIPTDGVNRTPWISKGVQSQY